jgi:rubrerythrin
MMKDLAERLARAEQRHAATLATLRTARANAADDAAIDRADAAYGHALTTVAWLRVCARQVAKAA